MRFIDWFAGIGGFRRGLELSGHECAGFCEYDDFAVASYTAMHLITKEQAKYLKSLTLKQRQKEILKPEYRNGEWYAKDISEVKGSEIPKVDIWCAGFPCQDISVAGCQRGLKGERSNLFFQFVRCLKEKEEGDRPEWVILENVKNLLSVNKGWDFARVLFALGKAGYNCSWQVFNSKDHGIPQNRERVYIVGHLGGKRGRKVFPFKGTGGENSVQGIEQIGSNGTTKRHNPQTYRVYDPDKLAPCLQTMEGGGREPHVSIKVANYPSGNQKSDIFSVEGIGRTLTATDYKLPMSVVVPIGGISLNQRGGFQHGFAEGEARTLRGASPQGVAIPVLTPDRAEKRQNGRRMKENNDPSFTLTALDRHGVAIGFNTMSDGSCRTIKNQYQKNSAANFKSSSGSRAATAVAVTMEAPRQGDGIFVETEQGFTVYAVWYEKYKCYIAIRKLTPKECFRLQGWEDKYFNRAAWFNSDSQLYKQAGNGVTVNVVEIIGNLIK